MKITLSVIVPIYNAEETLEKCVTSILRQGLHDMEMILVDDGSTDSSPEMQKRDYSEKGENRQAANREAQPRQVCSASGMKKKTESLPVFYQSVLLTASYSTFSICSATFSGDAMSQAMSCSSGDGR